MVYIVCILRIGVFAEAENRRNSDLSNPLALNGRQRNNVGSVLVVLANPLFPLFFSATVSAHFHASWIPLSR